MSEFNAGDKVRHKRLTSWGVGVVYGEVNELGDIAVMWEGDNFTVFSDSEYLDPLEPTTEETNAVSPNVYKFPKAEVRDISAHLTSFGGQAVQYVARSTRLDGLVKGNPEQDIEKAIQVLQWELERLEALNA